MNRPLLASLAFTLVAAGAVFVGIAQSAAPPDPYRWDQSWVPTLPDGREWGSTAGVGVDKRGNIYIAERCGGNPLGCDGKTIDPVVVFNPAGKTSNERIVKFTKDGRFIKTWGKRGTGPGEFDGPHAIAMDSRGRVFVADRSNNRIQIFDQEGKFLDQWKQFGRPSGIFIDKSDMMFVIDSETKQVQGYGYNPGGSRGIRIGSVKDGRLVAFIPDAEPDPDHSGSTGGEGIAEFGGVIYGFGDHRQKMVAQRRYVRQ